MTTAQPRIRSSLFAAAGLWAALLSTAPALAKKADPCAPLQRRASARLERGLLGCAGKGGTDAVGRCSATLWAKYRARLDRKGCSVPSSDPKGTPIGKVGRTPVLALIRADGFDASDLAVADTEARDAQLALRQVLRRLARLAAGGRVRPSPAELARLATDFTRAIARVDDAETTLADTENAIWNGFQTAPGVSWLIDEPLRVASEQLQIELRRLLGPEWRTEIAALRDLPACQGDFIGDRLVASYGEAALDTGTDRSAEVASLGRVAAQLACLSVRQTGLLDYALHAAYDRVTVRLRDAGLAAVSGPFARLIAPLELLVLDTVKQAGDHALAWHWFNDQRTVLLDEVARLGWATDDVVWLYDRLDGRLIGFPACQESNEERCVDLGELIDSITDPRALGLGDCALSGMVAAGPRSAGGVSRYACPSAECGAATPAPAKGGVPIGGIGAGAGRGVPTRGGATLPWSHFTASDTSLMQQLSCGRSGSGGGGAGGTSGDGGSQGARGGHGDWGSTNQCIQQALTAPRDPYAAYTRCVAAAAGRTPGQPNVRSIDLLGVPMGPDCRPGVAEEGGNGSSTTTPTTGGGASTTTQSAASSTTAAPPTTTLPATDTGSGGSTPKPCVPTGILDAIQKLGDCGLPILGKLFTGEEPTPSISAGAGIVVSNEIELLKPENGQIFYDTAGAIMQHKVDLACAAGDLSDDECSKLAGMKPADQAEYLRNKGKLQDCADPEQCSGTCTDLNSQVMQSMKACDQQLTDDLTPDGPGPLDPIINPSPESDTGSLPNDPLLSCMMADAPTDGGGVDLGCALVSCANGAATAKSGSACCGGGASATIGVSVGRLVSERTCQAVHCADGAALADDLGACGCGSAVDSPIGGSTPHPAPSPAGPGSGPRVPGR